MVQLDKQILKDLRSMEPFKYTTSSHVDQVLYIVLHNIRWSARVEDE